MCLALHCMTCIAVHAPGFSRLRCEHPNESESWPTTSAAFWQQIETLFGERSLHAPGSGTVAGSSFAPSSINWFRDGATPFTQFCCQTQSYKHLSRTKRAERMSSRCVTPTQAVGSHPPCSTREKQSAPAIFLEKWPLLRCCCCKLRIWRCISFKSVAAVQGRPRQGFPAKPDFTTHSDPEIGTVLATPQHVHSQEDCTHWPAFFSKLRCFTFAFGFGFGAGPCTGATYAQHGSTGTVAEPAAFAGTWKAVTATPPRNSIGWTQKTLHLRKLRFWQEQQPSPVNEIGRSRLITTALCTVQVRADKSPFFEGKYIFLAVLLRTTPHLLRNSGQRNQHFSGEKHLFWNMPRSRKAAGVVHVVTFTNRILGSSGFK